MPSIVKVSASVKLPLWEAIPTVHAHHRCNISVCRNWNQRQQLVQITVGVPQREAPYSGRRPHPDLAAPLHQYSLPPRRSRGSGDQRMVKAPYRTLSVEPPCFHEYVPVPPHPKPYRACSRSASTRQACRLFRIEVLFSVERHTNAHAHSICLSSPGGRRT